MRRSNSTIFLMLGAIIVIAIGVGAWQQAQPGATAVQQAQPFYNCNQTATATGAGNTTVTATLTPPAGQYVYICSINGQEVANAAITGAAGPAPILTSSGLPVNLIWWGDNSTQVTGWQKQIVDTVYPLLLKGNAPGTAVSVASTAGQATQNVRINITGFFAP